MKPRLSMKLLWKFLAEFQELGEVYEDATIGDFLNFVEKKLKTPLT